MSYDLMVFNPESAPRENKEFISWYKKQAEWSEDHNYDNPEVATEGLKNWFLEIIEVFPAMNGPYAIDDPDNPKVTEYSVGKNIIYACFSWSEAENAYPIVITLAQKNKVGFFDVSGTGDVFLPDEIARIKIPPRRKSWWKFW